MEKFNIKEFYNKNKKVVLGIGGAIVATVVVGVVAVLDKRQYEEPEFYNIGDYDEDVSNGMFDENDTVDYSKEDKA